MSDGNAKYVSKASDLQVILDYLSKKTVADAIQDSGLWEAVSALRRAIPLELELKLKAEQDVRDLVKASEAGTAGPAETTSSQAV